MKQRRFNYRISITASLNLLVCAAILSAVVLSIYFYKMRMEYFYKSEIRNELEMLAGTVSSQVSSALYTRRYESVDEIMKENIGRNELITDALIVQNEDSRIFYDILSAGANSREGKVFSKSMLMGDGDIYLSRPIVYNAGLAGGQPMDNEELGRLVLRYREMGFLKRERLHAMVSLARNMSLNLSAAVDMGYFAKMRDIMLNIQDSSLNLEYAYLMNNDGVFLYYYMNGLSTEAMRAKEGLKAASAAGRRALQVSDRKPLLIQEIIQPGGKEVVDITVPIMRKGKRIGVARIGYSLEDFKNDQKRTLRNLVAMTVVFILVGLVCAVFISIRISKPIRELVATVHLVGKGGYPDRQISVSSSLREVRELELSFNQMIEKRRYAEYELRQSEDQLRELARRVISAQEEERSRIAQELHDELGHRLLGLSLRMAAIRKRQLLPEGEISAMTDMLEETSGEIMRIFRGLSPSFIERTGLSEAVETFIEIIQSQKRIDVAVDIDLFQKDDLARETAINLFRIIQEAFNNIIKHSGAGHVDLSLKRESGMVIMKIADDGRGMDFDWGCTGRGLGMVGMRERAMVLGGEMRVDSRPGSGTSITVLIPLDSGTEEKKS